MSDVAAISSAMAEYAHLVDDGQVEEWADLFLEEGELDVGGRVMHGRAAIGRLPARGGILRGHDPRRVRAEHPSYRRRGRGVRRRSRREA